jgi:hypothetical protein
MRKLRALALAWFVYSSSLIAGALTPARAAPPDGNASIRALVGTSALVITTTNRLAGAIDSVKWKGQEFINSLDHGRQLQSACSFDAGSPQPFWAECYNPTEAGSRADGAGENSSSKLLSISTADNVLSTTIQMAFWLAPGEESSGRPALNNSVLSNHTVSKRVRIGWRDLPNVIDYAVTFHVPVGEHHKFAQFEALTGYMPPEFEQFWKFLPASRKLEPLDDGPGEQQYPVVFSNAAGTHAMGVYSPAQPSPGFAEAGYGRFRFQAEQVVKWNCVFRERNEQGIASGDRSFQVFCAIGSLEEVRRSLVALVDKFSDQPK